MWEPICLTLAAAAGNNIGKIIQKKGTVILPPLSFKLKVRFLLFVSISFLHVNGRRDFPDISFWVI